MFCPVCRAIPRGLQVWLLEVFESDNHRDPLYPIAKEYVRWGAGRIARGESPPFPVLRNHPGKVDPLETVREWLILALNHFGKRLSRESKLKHGYSLVSSTALERTPAMLRALAGMFEADERSIESAIRRGLALMDEYGEDVRFAVIARAHPKLSDFKTPVIGVWWKGNPPDG